MTTTTFYRRIAPLLLLLGAACAGAAAREGVTLPAMRAAWSAIKVEATREAVATQTGQAEVAAADAAMAAGTAAAIAAAPWGVVEALARADIQRRVDAAEIGPGVAASLLEELRLFSTSRTTFTRHAP